MILLQNRAYFFVYSGLTTISHMNFKWLLYHQSFVLTTRLKMFLSAKYYICNKQNTSLCSNCFEHNYQFLVCQGACLKQFCRSCFKSNGYRPCKFCECEMKPAYFSFKEAQFCCPSECSAVLKSQKEFDAHCEQCPHLPNQIREQFHFKRTFRCLKGHRLEYRLQRGPCSNCLATNYYTNLCPTCQEGYCTNCILVPCSKHECAIGHRLTLNIDRGSITCDLCSTQISRLGEKRIFSDRDCDFDVCLACHGKLPEEHPLPEFKFRHKEEEDKGMDEEVEMDID